MKRAKIEDGVAYFVIPKGAHNKFHIFPQLSMVHLLSDIKNAGHELILVSSGAIGLGVGLGWFAWPLLSLLAIKGGQGVIEKGTLIQNVMVANDYQIDESAH